MCSGRIGQGWPADGEPAAGREGGDDDGRKVHLRVPRKNEQKVHADKQNVWQNGCSKAGAGDWSKIMTSVNERSNN